MDISSDTANIFERVTNNLIQNFGPVGTVGLLLFCYIMAFTWRWYNDGRKDKEIHLALQEKERAVQRLANEVRLWRAINLKEKHQWSDDQIERFLITNNFNNPSEAREFLENEKPKKETGK